MTDDEFQKFYSDLITFIRSKNHEYKDFTNYEFGLSAAYLGYFDALGIRNFDDDLMALFKSIITERVNSLSVVNYLNESFKNFEEGFNQFFTKGVVNKKGDLLVRFYKDEMIRHIAELPNILHDTLDCLSDDDVKKLFEYDNYIDPTTGKSYKKSKILLNLDIDKFITNIQKLNNKNRNKLVEFLYSHYLSTDNEVNYYEDLRPLNEIRSKLEILFPSIKGIDRLSYNRLMSVMDKIASVHQK